MKKTEPDDDLLPEYDFTGAVRGKYARKYAEGTNVVVVALDPDVAERFPTSEAVNAALRQLAESSKSAG
jgi:hypothetical protein